MGNLLKVASLALFSAIGIATAVSVATHFVPETSHSKLAIVETSGDAPGRDDVAEGTPQSNLQPQPPTSAGPTVAFPVSVQSPNQVTAPAGNVGDWRQSPSSFWQHAPDPPAIPSQRPFGPVAMSTIDPTFGRYNSQRPEYHRYGQPSLTSPFDTFEASYQPIVTAQFNLLQDAINRIQETQEETTKIVTRIQDGQDRTPLPDGKDPPAVTATTAKQKVTMNEQDLLTLIFEDSDIKAVLNMIGIEAGLNILPTESVTGLVTATLTDVDVHTALDAVLRSRGLVSRREGNIVYVGTHEELHFVEHGGDVILTRVYRPNYISARDLQTLITPMLSPGSGQITISATAEVGLTSDSDSAGGDSYTGEDVVVVRDFEGILAQIDQLVAEVDKMPRQVSIEAVILSVALDDKSEMGVDFELLRQKEALRITSGTPLVNLSAGPFADGLKIGFLDSSVFAFLKALETIGETTVVASPRIMCLNKQRAEILIGSELGYISTTVTQTAAVQTVEFLEVGTQLSIRPFISSEGMIRMEVHPEVSAGSVRVEGGFTLPDKEVTQITTNVMCPDGATVVIGGLIREDLVISSTQIPFLGDLPWIGPAFRQRNERIGRSEIIVLLTPRIIKETDLRREGRSFANELKDRRDVFLEKMSPLGKRHIATRHYRKAVAAWNAGDVDTALRYCNLAIHFDPLQADAIALRNQVLSVAPDLEISVHDHLRRGLAPGHLPDRDYSKIGYPWRLPEHAVAEMGPLLEELDLVPVESESGTVERETDDTMPPVHTIEIGPPRASNDGG
jgi:type IV pilus assembly protein PilQ